MSTSKTYNIDGENSEIATRPQAIDFVLKDIRDTKLSLRLKSIEIVSESDRYEQSTAFPVRDFEILVTFDED